VVGVLSAHSSDKVKEYAVWWVIGAVVVVLVLVVVARRRNRRDPAYDDATRSRVDDHRTSGEGDRNFDRFGGGYAP
jgi:hypothetical protein